MGLVNMNISVKSEPEPAYIFVPDPVEELPTAENFRGSRRRSRNSRKMTVLEAAAKNIVLSKQGAPLLYIGHREYRRGNPIKAGCTWRCTTSKCPGRMLVVDGDPNYKLTRECIPHPVIDRSKKSRREAKQLRVHMKQKKSSQKERTPELAPCANGVQKVLENSLPKVSNTKKSNPTKVEEIEEDSSPVFPISLGRITVEEADEHNIVISKRGAPLLYIDHREYRHANPVKNGYAWRCTTKSCHGRMLVEHGNPHPVLVQECDPHPPKNKSVRKAVQSVRLYKRRGLSAEEAVHEARKHLSPEELAAFPSQQAALRFAHRSGKSKEAPPTTSNQATPTSSHEATPVNEFPAMTFMDDYAKERKVFEVRVKEEVC